MNRKLLAANPLTRSSQTKPIISAGTEKLELMRLVKRYLLLLQDMYRPDANFR